MAGRFAAILVGAVSFLDEGVPAVLVLSRKYSEMWLDHLAGAGDALRELGG